MILDDVRAARLARAFEDHDAADLGHPGGVAHLRAPCGFKLALDGRNRSCRFTRHDQLLDPAVVGEIDAHLRRALPHPQRVGRCRADNSDTQVDDALDA